MTTSAPATGPHGAERARSVDLLLEWQPRTPADLAEAIGLDLLEDLSRRSVAAA